MSRPRPVVMLLLSLSLLAVACLHTCPVGAAIIDCSPADFLGTCDCDDVTNTLLSCTSTSPEANVGVTFNFNTVTFLRTTLVTIASNAFSSVGKLRWLIVTGSLQTIEQGAFDGLELLEELDLYYSDNLGELVEGTFAGLTTAHLDILYNNGMTFGSGTFSGMTHVGHLFIAYLDSLATLPANLFGPTVPSVDDLEFIGLSRHDLHINSFALAGLQVNGGLKFSGFGLLTIETNAMPGLDVGTTFTIQSIKEEAVMHEAALAGITAAGVTLSSIQIITMGSNIMCDSVVSGNVIINQGDKTVVNIVSHQFGSLTTNGLTIQRPGRVEESAFSSVIVNSLILQTTSPLVRIDGSNSAGTFHKNAFACVGSVGTVNLGMSKSSCAQGDIAHSNSPIDFPDGAGGTITWSGTMCEDPNAPVVPSCSGLTCPSCTPTSDEDGDGVNDCDDPCNDNLQDTEMCVQTWCPDANDGAAPSDRFLAAVKPGPTGATNTVGAGECCQVTTPGTTTCCLPDTAMCFGVTHDLKSTRSNNPVTPGPAVGTITLHVDAASQSVRSFDVSGGPGGACTFSGAAVTFSDPTYTVALPADATSVTFDANCPVANDDSKVSTTGVAEGGRLVLTPHSDMDARLYSPLLTPTTACACSSAQGPANQEFFHQASGHIVTDVCPANSHEGIAGIAANDCRATVVDTHNGVQLYSLGAPTNDDLPACDAGGPTTRRLRALRLARLLTEGVDCCSTTATCMPLADECDLLSPI